LQFIHKRVINIYRNHKNKKDAATMVDQENPQPAQVQETESTDHDNEQATETLQAVTARIDTLLDTAPDVNHAHATVGSTEPPFKQAAWVPMDSIEGRQGDAKVKVYRVTHENDSKDYTLTYLENGQGTNPLPDDNPAASENKTVEWHVLPDGTVYEFHGHTLETAQTLEARIAELEQAVPAESIAKAQGSDSHEVSPSSTSITKQLRAFGARVLGRNKQ
jgi:hypothetical protein